MRFLKIMLVFLLCISMTSCATIIHGKKQDIQVTSTPPGAVVRVGDIATTTPGEITLDRSKPRYTLVFEKEGYKPVTVELRRGLDGWLFGNILLGGIIGIAIDFLTGSAYKIYPGDVDVNFNEKTALKLSGKDDVIVYVDMEYLKEKGIDVNKLEKIL